MSKHPKNSAVTVRILLIISELSFKKQVAVIF